MLDPKHPKEGELFEDLLVTEETVWLMDEELDLKD